MANKINSYDIIIIGAGIAGLYSAYNIKKISPEKSFLILEKNKKPGGRATNDYFYGHEVAMGAGIGRKRSDALLIKLMKDLKFKYSEFKTTVDLQKAIKPVDIMKIIDALKLAYKKHPKLHSSTFKDFFIKINGKKLYDNFVLSTGYTDYESADIYDTLYNYTMEDIIPGWTGLYISWSSLVDKLHRVIGGRHFKFSSSVCNIKAVDRHFEIMAGTVAYHANKIIIATTISGILKLAPYTALKIYKQIHAQPFLRVYAKFNKESSELLRQIRHYTILKKPLQKIIPMDQDTGIYMIAYSDNQNAIYLKKYIENIAANREVFCRLLEDALSLKDKLKINAIRGYYWAEGTHYYEPLNDGFKNREDFIYQAQRPHENIAVVGEAVSLHQGWVEGALESVAQIVTKKWINNV
jgi:hypothetical protein